MTQSNYMETADFDKGWPRITFPSQGQPLTEERDLAYRKRATSIKQAAFWNDQLKDDPIYGPTSGCTVGVAPLPSLQDGYRWELIWV